MRGTFFKPAHAAATALILAALAAPMPVPVLGPVFGTSARAQSVNSWSLPEPSGTPTPRGQGPVDAQNPVVRPSEAPAAPVPTITPPPPVVTPAARPSAAPSAAAPTPRQTASTPPRPAATATPTPEASATPQAPAPEAQPSPEADTAPAATPTPLPATASPTAPTTSDAGSDAGWPAWWWAAPLVLLAALGLLAVLRRRSRAAAEWEEPVPIEPEAAEPEAAAPPPAPAPPPPPAPAPALPAAAADAPVLEFEPLGLRLSLVYATLQYRVTVRAGADLAVDFPAGHLLGDMIGAHGSIPPEEQLAPPADLLAPLKPLPALAPGESAAVTGEILLPLGAIRPVRQGDASLFVPLVRLCLVAGDTALRRVYTVGLTGGDALTPLRLDTGPRDHRDLAAREVEAARAYAVDLSPLRRAV